VVVARSFARIFRQNAVHLGLQVITCPEMEASQGDELELATDVVVNLTSGKKFAVRSLDSASQAILNEGGLIHYVRNRLLDQTAGETTHD